MSAMRLNRFDTEVELLGDLSRTMSLPNEIKDLELAVTEVLEGRSGARGSAADQLLHHFLLHPGTEIDLAGQYLPDGSQHIAGRFLLHDVTGRASPQGT